jgi:tellurite resistance protein TerC
MGTFANSTWLWIGFVAFIILMLSLDLGLFNRKAHTIRYREATIWSIVWITVAMAFAGIVFWDQGKTRGLEFVTGYLIELSLSVDNLFVFLLIFSYFKVPTRYQHRVLFWGLLGALVLRLTMIFVGGALINRFHWIIYIFGAFLVYTGLKMFRQEETNIQPEQNPVVKLVTRYIPITRHYEEEKFFTRQDGRRVGTLLLLVLVIVEVTDLVFAVDSIPAIFAVTTNTFIVYTSNVFAILGLRSMYFLLAGVVERFHYLKLGLAIVLTFIGIKMLMGIVHIDIPISISLPVVALVLLVAVAASLFWPKQEQRATVVRLEGNPPIFHLSGSGSLAHLLICGSKRDSTGDDEDFNLWEIEPIGGYKKGRCVEDIRVITYGVVPTGYRQSHPDQNTPPPPLAPGTKYEYWFDTTDAPHARSYFVIRDIRSVVVED